MEREKPCQGLPCYGRARSTAGEDTTDHWHSTARDPQPQRSCHADGDLETANTNGNIPPSGVSQGNVAAHTPVTKHSPSLGLKGGTQEHPSSWCCLSPRLSHPWAVPLWEVLRGLCNKLVPGNLESTKALGL